MKVFVISSSGFPEREHGRFCQNFDSQIAWLTSPALGFFIKKSVTIHDGAATRPRPARTYEASWRSFGSPEAVPACNASRFLKQTQQRFIRGKRPRHNRETERHLGPDPGSDGPPLRLTLAKSLPSPPPQFPAQSSNPKILIVPAVLHQTLHSREFPPPPTEPRRRE